MANVPRSRTPAVCTLALLAAIGATPRATLAQTPQQLEYERQQREYWRAQEQQRQEQQRIQQLQQDNARRQQEELNRTNRLPAPSAPGMTYPSTPTSPAATAPSGAGRSAMPSSGVSERRYALPGHGNFVVQAPGGWKEQVQQPSKGAPPTIVFGPASGTAFQVMLTPTWPEPKDRGPLSRDELRAAVERGAQAAKSWAAESNLPLKEIQGQSGPGFYISATERAAKPGGHKYVTSGILRVGELAVPFTVTSNDGQGSVVQQALAMLKTAVHVSAASTATAPASSAAGAAPATQASATLRLMTVYTCNGERVVVQRCRSDADDAYCSVSYPDRKSAATKGLVPELAEQRGPLVKKLAGCQLAKS